MQGGMRTPSLIAEEGGTVGKLPMHISCFVEQDEGKIPASPNLAISVLNTQLDCSALRKDAAETVWRWPTSHRKSLFAEKLRQRRPSGQKERKGGTL